MLYLVFGFIGICYFLVIHFSIKGWTTKNTSNSKPIDLPFISLIIAARNEENNCETLLYYLKKQTYPNHLHEVIFINDHSTDNTYSILENNINQNENYFVYDLPSNITGKKQAIEFGQSKARGDYFLFTDADCTMNEKWIANYAETISNTNAHFLFGPVDHISEKRLLEKLFTLDFLSMVIAQAGLAKLGHAFSCNAANMCIHRDLSNASRNENFASGDDVFLLHSAKKINKESIRFIHKKDAIIYTKAPESISKFIQQRIRWSSKTGGYKDIDAIIISNLIYLVNASIFAIGVICIFYFEFLNLFIFMLSFKAIIDFYFFRSTLSFFNKTKLSYLSIPFQGFYFIYITLIPIFAILVPLKWKGRRIS